MSKVLIGYLLVAGLGATRVEGQDLSTLRARVDSAVAATARARAAIVAYRKSNPMRYDYSDSAVIGRGKVKVYFDKPLSALGREATTQADRQLALLGSVLDRAPDFVFSIVPDSQRFIYGEPLAPFATVDVRRHVAGAPRSPKHTSTEANAKDVSYAIVSEVTDASTFTWPLRRWTSGSSPITPGALPPTDWGELRLTMVSSVSHLGRDCFEGSIKACRLFLGLDSVADPARTLFDSIGRGLVVKYEGGRAYQASRVDTRRCLEGHDDACIAVINVMQFSALASPFVRASVVAQAIRLGGDKAVERMGAAAGRSPPGEVLSTTAGMPLDSVIADWQRHLGDRASGRGLPITVALSSLVWIIVCVLLAHRGSRWR